MPFFVCFLCTFPQPPSQETYQVPIRLLHIDETPYPNFHLDRVAAPKATPDADGWTKSLPKESWHPLKNGGFLMVKMRMEQSKQKIVKPPKPGGFEKMRKENLSYQKKKNSPLFVDGEMDDI